MAIKKRRKKFKKTASAPKTRTVTKYRTIIKKVRAKARRRARTAVVTARSTARRVKRRVSGMSSDRKELVIQAGFVGGGFLAGMAVANLAPLPSVIANSKFKGLIFLGLGILGAMKLKSSRAKSACVGLSAYGVVSTAKAFIPQLAVLGAVDSQRSQLIGQSFQASRIGNVQANRTNPQVIRTPNF